MTKQQSFLVRLAQAILTRAQNAQDSGTQEEGEEIKLQRKEMLEAVDELAQTAVREVMVPRIDCYLLPIEISREELLEKVSEGGHSRIPIYEGNPDNVIGVLYVKELLPLLVRGQNIDLRALIKPAFFVPETKRIDSLLREFKKRHVHIAVVIDEYGSVAGLVCLGDIIEEIVGEIQDEFEEEVDPLQKIGLHEWLCDASISLDTLNKTLGLTIFAENLETLGGYVLDLFGRFPSLHEKAEDEHLEFTVHALDGNRITKVKIFYKHPASE